jgi:hypothetical protein
MRSPSSARRAIGYWFEPAPPTDLAVSRVLFYIGLLVFYWREDFSAWGAVSRAFWMPMPAFEVFGLQPPTVDAIAVAQVVWRMSLALSAVGLFSRASMVVASALGFYLLGLPHNFGHVYHFDALLVIAMVTLACSRAADACSLDAWLTNRPRPAPSGEYTWPIRVIWLSMSLVFLGAGLAKLRHGGIEWVASPNLAIVLTRAAYHVSDADPLTPAGLWIAAHARIAESVAAFTLVIELAFASALVIVRARAVVVPAAVGLLVGIRVLMGPTFGGFLLANVFWVPWRMVGARLAAWVDGLRRSSVARREPVYGGLNPHAVGFDSGSACSRPPGSNSPLPKL